MRRGNDAKTFLADSLSYCRETEEKVLGIVRSRGMLTLKQIIGQLNASLGGWSEAVADD